MKNVIILLSLLLCMAISCKTINTNKSNQDTILAIKFMYSENYAMAINQDLFWKFPEEHAKLELHINNGETFLLKPKSFTKTSSTSFDFIKYAFIVKYGKEIDTIYADLDLNTWIVNKDGVNEYYEDEKREFSEDLKRRYGFFKDCW